MWGCRSLWPGLSPSTWPGIGESVGRSQHSPKTAYALEGCMDLIWCEWRSEYATISIIFGNSKREANHWNWHSSVKCHSMGIYSVSLRVLSSLFPASSGAVDMACGRLPVHSYKIQNRFSKLHKCRVSSPVMQCVHSSDFRSHFLLPRPTANVNHMQRGSFTFLICFYAPQFQHK